MKDHWLLTLQIPVAHSLGPIAGLPGWHGRKTSFCRKFWYPLLPPTPAHEQAVLVYDPPPRRTVIAHPYM